MKEIYYGINPIRVALENSMKIYRVWLDNDKKYTFENELARKKIEIYDLRDFPYGKYKLDKKKVQGVIFEANEHQLLPMDKLIEESFIETKNPILILCQEITDPQNLGSIIRNIASFNAQGVVLSKDNTTGVNGTVVKASAGTAFIVRVSETKGSFLNTIKYLKDNGFWIVSTTMDGENDLNYLKTFDRPLAIILGSEGKGISKQAIKSSDLSIRINISERVDSLNVASTSAIILYSLKS